MIKWLDAPEEHDYPAAQEYLSLVFAPPVAAMTVKALKAVNSYGFHAKDIFRASQLPMLGHDNSHVEKDLKKIRAGTPLSPLLLVRSNLQLIVADGYHRLCAVYYKDENAIIPCKLVTARELTDR